MNEPQTPARLNRPAVLACALAALIGMPASAGGGGAFATEYTQLLNNIQLAEQTIKQAAMVEQQIMTQINTYTTVVHGITNLTQAPQQLLNQALQTYQTQVSDLKNVLNVVQGVQSAATQVRSMVVGRAQGAASQNLSIGQYLQQQVSLANTQGGVYQTRLNQDIQTINNLSSRAAQLKQLSAQNQSITGNLQGLQLLNQQASLQAGELMEIKSALLSANVDRVQALSDKQDDVIVRNNSLTTTINGAKNRHGRDSGQSYQVPTPWQSTWPGVTTTGAGSN